MSENETYEIADRHVYLRVNDDTNRTSTIHLKPGDIIIVKRGT